jgi:ParB family chromosome partitioning protein
MSKNSIDTYGAVGKSNVLFFDPDSLVLVTDKTSPLYDSRVHNAIDEAMVLNIMHQGVFEPIIVSKNPETGKTEVVDGRQRVANAREANKRLRAKGCEPINVPGVARRGDPAALVGVMVSANNLRTEDLPINRAEKMLQLQTLGKDEATIAMLFGCSVSTVRSTLALLDCSAPVRNAVQAGKINLAHAAKLAKLDPAEQREKVAELIAAADTETGHKKAKKQRAVMGEDKPKMKSRKTIEAKMQDLINEGADSQADILAWVLGVE